MQSKQALALPERYGTATAPRHPETGKPICGNYSKRINRFGDHVCLSDPVHGRRRCRMHGGTSPRGFASPQFKTGRHTRYLPDRLIEGYETALKDEALLDLKSEVALLDARMGELLGRIDRGESAEAWQTAQTAFIDMQDALRANDAASVTHAMNRLDAILTAAPTGDQAVWDAIQELIQQRRKLVDTERKRLLAMQQFITREQALTLIAALSGILREEVKDPYVLARIRDRFARLTGEGTRSAASANANGDSDD